MFVNRDPFRDQRSDRTPLIATNLVSLRGAGRSVVDCFREGSILPVNAEH